MSELFMPTTPIIQQRDGLALKFNIKAKKPMKKKKAPARVITPESSSDEESSESSEEQPIEEVVVEQQPDAEPTIEAFWNLIGRIGWVNRSDLVMNETFVKNTIMQWGDRDVTIFKTFYTNLMDVAVDTLRNRFPNHDTETINEIASHFIALGKDWHAQVVEFSEFANIIVCMQDYQNFHAVLPDDLKK